MADNARDAMGQQVEFWRLKRVCEVTGLSKSEVYRRVADGRFPAPKKYPGSAMNFWPSTSVQRWMALALGDDFEELIGGG